MDLPSFNLSTKSATALRWNDLQKRVQQASKKSGFSHDVCIIASTRGLMVDSVIEACDAGVSEFAEDYLPEGVTKKPVITNRFPLTIWHFTGSLPPNKLHLAIEFFEWIHLFDKTTLLRPLKEAAEKHSGKKTKVLIEVNQIGDLKQKGTIEKDIPFFCDEMLKIPNVELMGLSCRSELMMPAEIAQKAYEKISNLHAKLLKEGALPPSAKVLAMGTSRDFEKAIEMGSTMIRVGSALFGKTAPSKSILPVDEY